MIKYNHLSIYNVGDPQVEEKIVIKMKSSGSVFHSLQIEEL